jgi:hypothetical protein
MNTPRHWKVDVVLCDVDENVNAYEVTTTVHAQATLVTDGHVFRGSGRARPPHADPESHSLAHEIAAARALSAVVQQLLDAALADVQDIAEVWPIDARSMEAGTARAV